MERYHTLYWTVVILGPLILGLICLILVALPGDPSTVGMLTALAVYLVIAIAGGILLTRWYDR